MGYRDYLGYVEISAEVVIGISCAIIAVALHRLILLNDRRPRTYFLFSLKRTEWLFIALSFLFFVAPLAVVFGFGIIGHVSGAIEASPTLTWMIAVLLVITGVYFYFRLLLLYPIIAVEKRLNIKSALTLSDWNFWRLFSVIVLGTLPYAIVFFAVFFFSIGVIRDWAGIVIGERPDRDILYQFLHAIVFLVSILSFVFSIASFGFIVPLLCYAYKALRNISPYEYLDEETGEPLTVSGSDIPSDAWPEEREL